MRFLHAGCGLEATPPYFPGASEVRLDLDPRVNPDIVASIADLGDIGTFKAIYSSHVLEHLWPHELPVALGEFWRVLEPDGVVVLFVPDLEDVRATEDVLFECIAGPITGLDLIYGHRRELEDRPYMAHRNGFTSETLGKALQRAAFREVQTKRMFDYNLLATGRK